MWVYFMSGTEKGVRTTDKRQKYLIGSDVPELLVQVIQAKKQKLARVSRVALQRDFRLMLTASSEYRVTG